MGGDDEEEEDDVEEHQDEDGQVKEEEGLVTGVADEAGHIPHASLEMCGNSIVELGLTWKWELEGRWMSRMKTTSVRSSGTPQPKQK